MDAEYRYGEADDYNLPPTGMINEIQPREDFFSRLKTGKNIVLKNLRNHKVRHMTNIYDFFFRTMKK